MFAWVERGYAPRVRIEGRSPRFKGLHLSPVAFSPAGDVLAAPGTSCRHQVHDLSGVVAQHPAVLIRGLMSGLTK